MASASALLADPAEFARAGWTVGITVVVLFVLVIAVGFAILFRRRNATASSRPGSPETRAGVLLVRLDDAVKSATDELGFAIAQFGEGKTGDFAAALATAKAQLIQAFALKQQLDDAVQDTETQRHEWNNRIISLCESAGASLSAQEQSFAALRGLERDAPKNLAATRELIATASTRVTASAATMTALRQHYAPNAIATVSDSVDQAKTLLASAGTAADAAEARITEGTVADTIQSARQDVVRAAQLLDGVDRLASALADSSARLGKLATEARDDLTEARATRDSPPDPETGAAVNAAIAGVDGVLAKLGDPDSVADPAGGIRELEDAVAALDVALGSARNQTQRLEHAHTALTGALLTARSQLSTTTDFIDGRRGGVGADARTRLAEAQRLLTIAEAEADPVTALDTARSSATYSRDADALARYDVMGR